jgi:phosphatidylserine/phosphatidylglycerophosphate/cardiolipin synthase-like enzyme
MEPTLPFVKTCSYPVRTTSEVGYLIDGSETFAAITDAIEDARRSVYITGAFVSLNFRMKPPSSEQLLDLLRRAAARGVCVAVLFWKPETATPDTVSPDEAPLLGDARVLARWDTAKAPGVYERFHAGCHHQKTFVVDGNVAFVGGLNMVQAYWDTTAHAPDDDRRVSYDETSPERRAAAAASDRTLPYHDTFARVVGPAVSDVEANFIERWNGATDRGAAPDLAPSSPLARAAEDAIPIQIVRTIPANTYPHTAAGETSVREAMLNLISGARQSVYFENQYFFDERVTAAIRAAAERGVRVVGLITRKPDAGQGAGVLESVLDDVNASAFQWTSFNPAIHRLVQLYTPYTEKGSPKDIYVHSKTMVVDDRYVLLGSANIAFTSLDFHSEMCVLVDHAPSALALRRRLWAEHLCCQESDLPITFGTGANLWLMDGVRNQGSLDSGTPLKSRVVPFTPPSVKNAAVLRAASGLG